MFRLISLLFVVFFAFLSVGAYAEPPEIRVAASTLHSSMQQAGTQPGSDGLQHSVIHYTPFWRPGEYSELCFAGAGGSFDGDISLAIHYGGADTLPGTLAYESGPLAFPSSPGQVNGVVCVQFGGTGADGIIQDATLFTGTDDALVLPDGDLVWLSLVRTNGNGSHTFFVLNSSSAETLGSPNAGAPYRGVTSAGTTFSSSPTVTASTGKQPVLWLRAL